MKIQFDLVGFYLLFRFHSNVELFLPRTNIQLDNNST